MLLSKTIMIKWHNNNKKWYEEKGYPFTKIGDEFEVKVKDLSKGSNARVNVECDGEYCENPYLKPIIWQKYLECVKEDGKYYCHKCSRRLFGIEKMKETILNNNISFSFYDWCYNNLSKEEADKIMERWDYELNIKYGKTLSPKDISYCSRGFDNKGYWFKCLDRPEHKSELKNIKSFINSQKGSLNCHQCNTITTTHPHLIKYIKNKENVYKYSYSSHKDIPMICPDCGYEKEMNLNTLTCFGFSCRCSDKKSYPEKFIFNLFEQLLNNDFQTQLSKKFFKWCSNYRYDFYIDKIKCIIETHGM